MSRTRSSQSRWFRRGQAHRFDNLTDEDASILVVSTPGLFGEDCFRSISEPVAAAAADRRTSPPWCPQPRR